jgi:hypothetical protein
VPAVSFSDAALRLGLSSRSTLYRLRDRGELGPYLRPGATPRGAQRLELEPVGEPPLAEHVARSVQARPPRAGGCGTPRPLPQQTASDAAWAAAARSLTETLATVAGPTLTGPQAQLLAAALPAALAAALGPAGLEQHRRRLVSAGCWRAGEAASREDLACWAAIFGPGDWRPADPLEDGSAEWWDAVAGALAVSEAVGPGALPWLSGDRVAELWHSLAAASEAVSHGARLSAGDVVSLELEMGDLLARAGEPGQADEGEDREDLWLLAAELQLLKAGGALTPQQTRDVIQALAKARARLESPR